eukprot:CAMPEP_0185729450 /NCGR_PEP_ID=MMETSP1171-20130828/5761_1 /TAXON_ID=374046 /ORGANISM="Helicotheca tamensis, Strain CCMP826" /LENGTH=44 /DNA_ID= /DNA_START= /DNA_END= /DNA_ORIENTATION=
MTTEHLKLGYSDQLIPPPIDITQLHRNTSSDDYLFKLLLIGDSG